MEAIMPNGLGRVLQLIPARQPDFESGLLDHLGRFQGLRERTQMHLTQSYIWSLLNWLMMIKALW